MKLKKICSFLLAGIMGCSMMSMLPASAESIKGDVNQDGIFNTLDVISFQKWLSAVPDAKLSDWESADFYQDGKLNIFDFCLMKKALLNQKTTPAGTGKLYQKAGLTDQTIGLTAYEGIVPDGWSAQLQSNWSCVNDFPGQETAIFVSPDGDAMVQISSPQQYRQNSSMGNGIVLSQFATYLTYMNAETYIDNFVRMNYNQAELIKEIEIPEEQKEFVQNYAFQQAKDLDDYIRQTGMNWKVMGYEGTVSRRQYQTDNGISEYCCAVSAYQYSNSGIGVTTTYNIPWRTLNTVAYFAKDQETFDKYYEDYEMITANGYFTAGFYSAVDYVLGCIAQAIAQNIIEENSGKTASLDYSSSGTEISDSNRETQERVFQAWDDYIKEEDTYTTTDGTTVRTSMYNQTVAQDGDKFYVGDVSGIPDGYTALTKN